MRLYSGQVPIIAEEILRTLVRSGDLDVEEGNKPEVEMDIQSVLREYIRVDRDLTSRARDELAKTGDARGSLGKIRRRLAKERGIDFGDDPLGYIITQLIEGFLHSHWVEEVYATDNDLRRKLKPILTKHMNVEDELDQEVRKRIKNLEEGSQSWDIEYQKAMENMRRAKKLE